MMDFRAESTSKSVEMGKVDGKAAVEQGEGFMFDKIKQWTKTANLKEKFPRLQDFLRSFNRANENDNELVQM